MLKRTFAALLLLSSTAFAAVGDTWATGKPYLTIAGGLSYTTVATLSLPAGSYVVTAKLYGEDFSTSAPAGLYCYIYLGNQTDDMNVDIPPGGSQALALHLAASTSTATTAALVCRTTDPHNGNYPGPGVSLVTAKLIATQIGTLTNQ